MNRSEEISLMLVVAVGIATVVDSVVGLMEFPLKTIAGVPLYLLLWIALVAAMYLVAKALTRLFFKGDSAKGSELR